MQPQRRALADSRQLRSLEMRERELWRRAPLPREVAQLCHHAHDPLLHDLQAFGHLQDLGVVGDERRSRAEVNDRFGRGRLQAERIDVRHHVMPDLALATLGVFIVDVLRVHLHLRDLLLGDRKPKLFFSFGERDPEPSPRSEFEIGREEVRHFIRCVPIGERVRRGIASHVRIITSRTED